MVDPSPNSTTFSPSLGLSVGDPQPYQAVSSPRRVFTLGLDLPRFVDPNKPEEVAAAIDGKTRCVYAETVSNPRLQVTDMDALVAVAHSKGLPVIVDDTSHVSTCPPGRVRWPVAENAVPKYDSAIRPRSNALSETLSAFALL